MQFNSRDRNVERKISIPVYLEGQVFGIDWLVQFFYLIVVQLFIRIFQAINGAYKSFLQERRVICMEIPTEKYILCVKDSQRLAEAQKLGQANEVVNSFLWIIKIVLGG